MSATYKADFNLWIEQIAQLLRSHRWHEVDIEHLIEEVEGLCPYSVELVLDEDSLPEASDI
ncbi:DUF29 family protein [Nostoc sp.]|uniref:DUF29 family protein n=1 Tax=Nostoc sp. TaxID=1180 RepID=UPI002FF5C0DE